MFNYDYSLTWEELKIVLGFAQNCSVDLEFATRNFDKLEFWHDITELNNCDKPRTNDIHNPTLRFLHRWIGVTLFPREDVRIVKNDDLRVMYAMVHKIHVAPVKVLVAHWLSVSERKGPIEFTSLISRIAETLSVLLNNRVQFILSKLTC